MSCAKMLDELCPFSFFITFAEGHFSSKDKLMKIPMVEKFFRTYVLLIEKGSINFFCDA